MIAAALKKLLHSYNVADIYLSMAAKKAKKKLQWQWSDAKGLLFQDIIDGHVPLEYDRQGGKTAKQIFEERYVNAPAFQISNFNDVKAFGTRLTSIRSQIRDKMERAQEDAMALQNDRLIYPKPTIDSKGLPKWKGSVAQELLIIDLKKKKHKRLTPMQLRLTKPEYQTYPLDCFRNRIYKELRKLKKGSRKKHGVRTNK